MVCFTFFTFRTIGTQYSCNSWWTGSVRCGAVRCAKTHSIRMLFREKLCSQFTRTNAMDYGSRELWHTRVIGRVGTATATATAQTLWLCIEDVLTQSAVLAVPSLAAHAGAVSALTVPRAPRIARFLVALCTRPVILASETKTNVHCYFFFSLFCIPIERSLLLIPLE